MQMGVEMKYKRMAWARRKPPRSVSHGSCA